MGNSGEATIDGRLIWLVAAHLKEQQEKLWRDVVNKVEYDYPTGKVMQYKCLNSPKPEVLFQVGGQWIKDVDFLQWNNHTSKQEFLCLDHRQNGVPVESAGLFVHQVISRCVGYPGPCFWTTSTMQD